ncbi:MAG: flippase-like domain-containing protein [Phycisphaerales bacterium]|nr:flippase-like domain-containing protein [Phycisphaerales bacterium]
MSDGHEDPGLHGGHHHPVVEAMEPPRRWSRARIAIQVLGFLICLGLLGFTIHLATTGDNAQQFRTMLQAPPGWLLALLACSGLSIVLNGLMFWVVLLPHRRLNAVDVVATNAIATFMALLPFKLGLLVRGLIHHRRDQVPFKLLLGWFAAMSALGLAVVLPMGAAGLWRGRVDTWWWVVAIAGPLLCTGTGVVCGRLAGRFPILSRLSMGADMIVRDVPTVVRHYLIRMMDVALLAGRFLIAGHILGHDMTLDQAILVGTTYFLLSVLAPTGTLGAREAGTAGIGLVQGLDVAGVALLVSVAETLAAGALGGAGAWRLRLDRLLARRNRGA